MAAKKPKKPTKKLPKMEEDWFTLLLDELQAARREIAGLHAVLHAIHTQGEGLMATVADLQQKLTESANRSGRGRAARR